MTTLAKLATTPYWSDSASLPRFPPLERDERADVVIVGGGITGLTAAYLLTVAGRSVAVLERARCGQIDTGHTSAHLTMVVDERATDLVKNFGRDHARATFDVQPARSVVKTSALTVTVSRDVKADPDRPNPPRQARLTLEAQLFRAAREAAARETGTTIQAG